MSERVVAAVAVLAVIWLGQAEDVLAQALPDSGTLSGPPAGIAILTTNGTPGTAIQCQVGKTISLWVTASSGSTTNSGGEGLTFLFGKSMDNVYFSTNRTTGSTVTLSANGTNSVTANTAVTMTGARFFRYQGLENPAGGQGTNFWTNVTVSFYVQ